MKSKKNIAIKIALSSIGLGCVVVGLVFNTSKAQSFFYRAAVGDYSLELVNKKISTATSSYTEEISASVNTVNGSALTFKASNVINYNSGWQTVLPNGYFYNPLTNTTNHNKISGIQSIKFESPSNSELSLYYGSSINNDEIIYSHAKTLNSGAAYTFTDEYPNYFYIKNESGVNVNISKLTINYSCSDTGYARSTYNVLMIGNSFSDDTVKYASRVANAYGITLNIYDAYIASCTLDTHYANLVTNPSNAAYSMRSNNGNWIYDDSKTLTQIINFRTWDAITFQQASSVVGRSSSYSKLQDLTTAVRNLVGNGPKFYWYQTWAYDKEYADSNDYFAYFNNDQTTMYNAINTCYQSQVASLGVFEDIIAAGTAVQNLRTSYMKETFSRDGKHMSNVHGCYLLGLNIVSKLLDIDFDLSPCSYLPTEASESFKTVCYESIKNAYKTPLACTNSAYSTYQISGYNLNNYTEIDAELLGCSYWNSTDSSYNSRHPHDQNTSNLFVSTKRFTSSTLPVGSLVVVGESFGCRPEAWVTDAQQSSRPNETYDNLIVIDSNFFNGYQYRAFNIFKENKSNLSGNYVGEQYSQIFDNFHIYVPNSSMSGLTPKSTNVKYTDDKALFEANGYKIDSFERVHLDPITGFYKCDGDYYLRNSYSDDNGKRFVCTRAFYTANGDLPEHTIIIVDSGFQWRSDCWGAYGTYSPRPSNVSNQFTVLDSSFMSSFRRRTFNVSSTSSAYVYVEGYNQTMNHMRIYVPTSDDIYGDKIAVTGVTLSDSSKTIVRGSTYALTATVSPSNAFDKSVTWTSSNSSVASVSSSGVVTANAVGNATITVRTTDGGFTATCAFSVVNPVDWPEGTYKGSATVLGSSIAIIISIGTQSNGLVAVRLANTDAVATSITVSGTSVTIQTTGSYSGKTFGNITATYSKANNRLSSVKCNGSISSYVSNNGSITCTKPTTASYFNCDGTTAQLQNTFKRRYMSGSWQVDTGNADRITSNTTEFVSGTSAVKRRGYSGGPVALNFNSDFSPALTLANVYFWVYNPSSSDITLRMWYYRAANFGSNGETGSVVAKANGWTYLAMGFTSGTVYNFQIADFTNSGVYLTFDDIYLY